MWSAWFLSCFPEYPDCCYGLTTLMLLFLWNYKTKKTLTSLVSVFVWIFYYQNRKITNIKYVLQISLKLVKYHTISIVYQICEHSFILHVQYFIYFLFMIFQIWFKNQYILIVFVINFIVGTINQIVCYLPNSSLSLYLQSWNYVSEPE